MDEKGINPTFNDGSSSSSSSAPHVQASAPPEPSVQHTVPVRSDPPYPTMPSSTASVHHNQPPQQSYQAPYPEAPPSYQAAVTYPSAYPAAPTYGQPAANPTYQQQHPKPNYGNPPTYHQQIPPPPGPTITITQLPQPPPQRPPAIVVHVGQGPPCTHCHSGLLIKETDMCCLLCIILLTIFTFPVGLIFLCCIPCSVHRKCTHCRRVG